MCPAEYTGNQGFLLSSLSVGHTSTYMHFDLKKKNETSDQIDYPEETMTKKQPT